MEKGITTENLIKCLSFIRDAYKNLAENSCHTGRVAGKGADFPVKLETNKELYEYHAYVMEAAISAVEEVQQHRERDGLTSRNGAIPELPEVFELIRQNPDLPIVPMVDYEIVAGDYATYWMASWGNARIDSYLLKDERVWFLSDEKKEIFEKFFEFPEGLPKGQEETYIKEKIASLPWTEAIIVNIEPL